VFRSLTNRALSGASEDSHLHPTASDRNLTPEPPAVAAAGESHEQKRNPTRASSLWMLERPAILPTHARRCGEGGGAGMHSMRSPQQPPADGEHYGNEGRCVVPRRCQTPCLPTQRAPVSNHHHVAESLILSNWLHAPVGPSSSGSDESTHRC